MGWPPRSERRPSHGVDASRRREDGETAELDGIRPRGLETQRAAQAEQDARLAIAVVVGVVAGFGIARMRVGVRVRVPVGMSVPVGICLIHACLGRRAAASAADDRCRPAVVHDDMQRQRQTVQEHEQAEHVSEWRSHGTHRVWSIVAALRTQPILRGPAAVVPRKSRGNPSLPSVYGPSFPKAPMTLSTSARSTRPSRFRSAWHGSYASHRPS